jgi:phage repressor protein C with HTH and peptisase S24 domain
VLCNHTAKLIKKFEKLLFSINILIIINIKRMSTLLERAKKVAEHKGMSMAQFQEKIGVSISHFYNTDRLSLKTKRAVSEVFPDINADWLETGEGFMTNTDKLQEEGKFYKVPLLPVAAQGGTPNNFEYQIQKHDCEMMISPIENISMAITVTGDSMSPEYPSGSKVLVQKINEKAFIEWGNTYVLDTVNGAIVKNVFQAKGDDTKIICRSVNPNFADFSVDISDIRGWYRVRCCITIK